MLPYTEGVSEDVKQVCRKIGMKVIFRSGQSLRSMLTKANDPLMMEKQVKVVYLIPCSCDEAYIGETVRRLERDLSEGAQGCMSEGSTEKVSIGRA